MWFHRHHGLEWRKYQVNNNKDGKWLSVNCHSGTAHWGEKSMFVKGLRGYSSFLAARE